MKTKTWLPILQPIIEEFNRTPTRSLPDGMAPDDVTEATTAKVYYFLYSKR